jgi:hypothetical protein
VRGGARLDEMGLPEEEKVRWVPREEDKVLGASEGVGISTASVGREPSTPALQNEAKMTVEGRRRVRG